MNAPSPVRVVGVLGAGTMGQGIAQVTATAGIVTRVFDQAPGRAQQAVSAVGTALAKHVAKGRLRPEQQQGALSMLSTATSARNACDGVDLVIEAAPEDMAIKVALLRDAAATAPERAIIASNTSSLSITELGARIGAAD